MPDDGDYIRFSSEVDVDQLVGVGALVTSDKGSRLFSGAVFAQLCGVIDGSRTVGAVVDALYPEVALADAYYALGKMVDAQVLRVGRDEPAPSFGPSTLGVVNLTGYTLRVEGALVPPLAERSPEPDRQRRFLVFVDDYLAPRLPDFNAAMIARGASWLPCCASGETIWIGPELGRAGAPCWQCLAERIERNRRLLALAVESGAQVIRTSARERRRHFTDLAVELALVQARRAEPLDDLLVFAPSDVSVARHPTLRRPQCPACGDAAPGEARVDTAALRTAEGLTRGPLDELRPALERLISPVTGLISSVAALDGEVPGLIALRAASHPFVARIDNLDTVRRHLTHASGGKGATVEQAEAAAICEAIERESGRGQGGELAATASFSELGDRALHPNAIGLWSDRQLHGREHENAHFAKRCPHNYVPEPLDADAPISWSNIWSLRDGRPRLVPLSLVYYGNRDPGWRFAYADSNGCACGQSLAEAVAHGFLEVFERDAVAMWWYNRVRRPGIDLDAFDSALVRGVRAHLAGLGRSLWAIDITNDMGVPVIVALSHRVGHPREDIVFGFGCHPDPARALDAAILEALQTHSCVARRDDRGETQYHRLNYEAVDWWLRARTDDQPHLRPDPDRPPRRPEDFAPDPQPGVACFLARIERAGLEAFVLDQSRPDLPLRVAKVVVPGMRMFWRRFAPGRLYDVPVRLGWLDTPRREEDLNPWTVFF